LKFELIEIGIEGCLLDLAKIRLEIKALFPRSAVQTQLNIGILFRLHQLGFQLREEIHHQILRQPPEESFVFAETGVQYWTPLTSTH
jgi:hypothetical protein